MKLIPGVLVIGMAFTLGACGSETTPSAPATAAVATGATGATTAPIATVAPVVTQAPIPAVSYEGMTKVDGIDLSFYVPKTWIVFYLDPKSISEYEAGSAAGTNSLSSEQIGRIKEMAKQDLKVFAVDGDPASNAVLNVKTDILPIPMSADIYTPLAQKQLENTGLIELPIKSRKIKLDSGKDGVELTYKQKQGADSGTVFQYVTTKDSKAVVITLITTNDQVEASKAIFEKIGKSVSVK